MKLNYSDLQFRDKWQWHSADGNLSYSNGAVPGKLLYSKLHGAGNADDVAAVATAFETALNDGDFKGKSYIRIADYSDVSNIAISTRRAYVKMLKRLEKKYDARPAVTYVCGADFWVRSAMKVYAATLAQRVVFVPTVEAAIADINGEDAGDAVSDLSLGDMVFRDEWEYISSTTNYKCAMGVVPGQVLYYRREGVPEMDDARWVVEELFPSVLLEGKMRGRKISFVWESIDSAHIPHALRKYVYNAIKEFESDMNSEIVRMYVCGKRGFIYNLANVFSKGLGFKLYFVKTVEQALVEIAEKSAEAVETQKKAPIAVTEEHIEEINRLMGELLMSNLDSNASLPSVSSDNPLFALKNTFDIAHADMVEMRRNDLRLSATLKTNLSLLTATLESTADGILVVNRQGRVTLRNGQFGRMWNLSEELLASNDDEQLIDAVLSQLVDPEGFVDRIKMLYASPSAKSFDILELKDGRVYERYSKPQVSGDTIMGRVWSFRDVSDRRIAEQNLLESNRRLQEATDNAQELAR